LNLTVGGSDFGIFYCRDVADRNYVIVVSWLGRYSCCVFDESGSDVPLPFFFADILKNYQGICTLLFSCG